MDRPRVLRVINRFNLGGPTFNAAYLTKYMESDFDTRLIGGAAQDHEGDSTFILDKVGVEATVIPELSRSISAVSDWKAFQRVRATIREFKPHIVHTHASKAGAIGRVAARIERVPIVVHTFHGHVFEGYFGPMKSSLVKATERRLSRVSSSVIAISQAQKDDLVDKFSIADQSKVKVIPLGLDLEPFQKNMDSKRREFRRTYGLSVDHVAVGIIGRLTPIKNHGFFLDAIERILPSIQVPVRFFIVGDGEEREMISARMKSLNKSAGQELITMTSWLREVDVVNAGVDLICLTSLNEGTPVSLIEAQAACNPVLSTHVGGVGDVVEHGVTGLLVDGQDLEGYARQLHRLIHDRALRLKLSEHRGRETMDRFHYHRLVTEMSEHYDQLLGKIA